MTDERAVQLVKRLELLDELMNVCGAESVHIVNEAGLNLTIEVVINRAAMGKCAKGMIEKNWDATVIGIEKINKGERGWSETGDGLYRYTLQFTKTF